jgi:hypothetical protein
MLVVEVHELVADHGSVVTFQGSDADGGLVTFSADWRSAQGIADILYAEGPFPVAIEPWQVLCHTPVVP